MTVKSVVVPLGTSVVHGLVATSAQEVQLVPGASGSMVLEYTTQKSPRLSSMGNSGPWTAWPFGAVTQPKSGLLLAQVTAIRVTAITSNGTFVLNDNPGAIWNDNIQNQSEIESMKLIRITTDANPAVMSTDGGPAIAGNQILVPAYKTYLFDILLVARRTDANDVSGAYRHTGIIDRNAGANTTAISGSVTKVALQEDDGGWDSAVTADTTLGGITITVTGDTGQTVRWVAKVSLVEA